ncbi:helix-turn-helix domain-containing protein [Salinicoccus bachuensis]|uniref:Helix-turn-helix domain-containing protein n=1 Tax=Salinicoccus bachuensis TaxID=3136731 RepID=A0ABZ3CFD3_9STAP
MENHPSYFGFITAEVRYDPDLTGDEKILYAEITALSNKHGYCYASNDYFANLFSVTDVTVSRRLKKLKSRGYISIVYKRNGTVVTNRKIYPSTQTATAVDHSDNGPLSGGAPAVDGTVKENSITDNNITRNNITNKEHAHFEDFYTLYSKKKARPKASKAFDRAIRNHEWDIIRAGTIAYLKSIKAEDKRFQAYPATFLNEERFLDDHEYVKGNLYEADSKPASEDGNAFLKGL